MAFGVKVVGVEKALQKLNREVENKEKAFHAGLIAAGLELERLATLQITNTLYAQPEPPEKVRKRTGNLRASRYTVWTQGPTRPTPSFKDTKAQRADNRLNRKVAAEAGAVGIDEEGDAAEQAAAFTQAVGKSKGEVDARDKKHFAVIVGYGASYALFVHEGTSRMVGYHWLVDALNLNIAHLKDIVRRYSKDASLSVNTELTPSTGETP